MERTPRVKNVAMVSGGLGDIGLAIVRELVKKGIAVSIGDLYPSDRFEVFFDEIKTSDEGIQVSYNQVDVRDHESVECWVEKTVSEMGVPNIIIPNAATVTLAGMMEVTPTQWTDELRVNLDGAFYLARFAAAKLLEAGEPGRIVFVGSWAAHAVHSRLPVYSISKAAVRMLTKCLALELAPHGILVNEIAPGYVDAGLTKKVFDAQISSRAQSQEKVPTGKIITAAEVAKNVVWLSDLSNDHITGSTLLMDGGLSLLS